MTTIYKFHLESARTTLNLPLGAQVLTVQVQYGAPCIWVRLDPTLPNVERRVFDVYGTGHTITKDERLTYIGTFQMQEGALVFHVFENRQ